ncbi:hypothetical protein F1H90_07065 [Salmonella enterica]|nr:hypothetical protein [Salmonella enterica]
MTTITREQAQAVSDLKEGYTLGHADVAILQGLARIALASLKAKPIGEVVKIGPALIADFYGQVTSGDKLYAAPPAPVEQSPEIIDYEHRMICGELRPVPKFRVEETYHNMLKEEQEVNAKLAEYSLNKSLPQPTPESEDRKMLKRLAVIMSGSDSGGEISALTVTAQSLVDRCKTLALEKVKCPFSFGWDELKRRTHQDALFFSAWMTEGEEITYLHRDIVSRTVNRLLKVIAACQSNNSPSELMTWNPASLEEVNKRSVREPTTTFPPAKGPQIPPMASSQTTYIALHSPKLPVEVLAAIKEVVRIRLDFNEFDGDRRGIGNCLERAEQKLTEIINKNAALLDKEIA